MGTVPPESWLNVHWFSDPRVNPLPRDRGPTPGALWMYIFFVHSIPFTSYIPTSISTAFFLTLVFVHSRLLRYVLRGLENY